MRQMLLSQSGPERQLLHNPESCPWLNDIVDTDLRALYTERIKADRIYKIDLIGDNYFRGNIKNYRLKEISRYVNEWDLEYQSLL